MNSELVSKGFKTTELRPLPVEWEVGRLGDYCNVHSGYAFKSQDFCEDGILVVKIGNFKLIVVNRIFRSRV
jgi:type I restriction enzyme S subunit